MSRRAILEILQTVRCPRRHVRAILPLSGALRRVGALHSQDAAGLEALPRLIHREYTTLQVLKNIGSMEFVNA